MTKQELEKALGESEEKVKTLVEAVPDANSFGGSGEAYGILTKLSLLKRKLAKVKLTDNFK